MQRYLYQKDVKWVLWIIKVDSKISKAPGQPGIKYKG